ncbi:MAG: cytochrome PufQ [Gemmobacter sp.]
MTDHSVNMARPRSSRASTTEFTIYFALIFALALPFAVLGWIGSALRHGRLPAQGPLKRAWCEARQITPMIFTA